MSTAEPTMQRQQTPARTNSNIKPHFLQQEDHQHQHQNQQKAVNYDRATTPEAHHGHPQQLKAAEGGRNMISPRTTFPPPSATPPPMTGVSGLLQNHRSSQQQKLEGSSARGSISSPKHGETRNSIFTLLDGGDGGGENDMSFCEDGRSQSTSRLDNDDADPLLALVQDCIARQQGGSSSQCGVPVRETVCPASPDSNGEEMSQLETAAKEQLQAVFKLLQERSGHGLLLIDLKSKDRTIIYVNMAAQRTLARLDLIGKPLSEVIAEDSGSCIRWPKYHDKYITTSTREGFGARRRKGAASASEASSGLNQFADVLTNLEDSIQEYVLPVKRRGEEGQMETFEASVFVTGLRTRWEPETGTPRIFAIGLRNDTEALRVSKIVKVMKSALSFVSEGVVIADLEGKIEWMNEAAEKLSGHALSTVLEHNQSVSLFVANDFRDRHESYLRYFAANYVAAMRATESNGRKSCQEVQQELLTRTDMMNTSFGPKEVKLRVEVLYGSKLVGYIKSTRDFIPRKQLEKERLKLLLPTPIVQKVLADPSVALTDWTWDWANMSVIFTDVKGFSTWSREQPVKVVHDRMQPMFQEFERIVQSFGGELVHRIGDAVMALFGLSGHDDHHARLAVACATEMQLWASEHHYQIRLGIATGPLQAAVKGSFECRPSFEIWGNAVDVAKRLESEGLPDHLHLAASTVRMLGGKFKHVLDKVLRSSMSSPSAPILRDDNGEEMLPPRGLGEAFFVQCAGKAYQAGATRKQQETAESVRLPDDFLQLVKFQQSEFAKWKKKEEEKAQRLAELERLQ